MSYTAISASFGSIPGLGDKLTTSNNVIPIFVGCQTTNQEITVSEEKLTPISIQNALSKKL